MRRSEILACFIELDHQQFKKIQYFFPVALSDIFISQSLTQQQDSPFEYTLFYELLILSAQPIADRHANLLSL